jgi:hypothetical protein
VGCQLNGEGPPTPGCAVHEDPLPPPDMSFPQKMQRGQPTDRDGSGLLVDDVGGHRGQDPLFGDADVLGIRAGSEPGCRSEYTVALCKEGDIRPDGLDLSGELVAQHDLSPEPNKRHRSRGSLRRTMSPRVTVAACTLTRISFGSGAGPGTSASSSRSADPDLLNKTTLIGPVPSRTSLSAPVVLSNLGQGLLCRSPSPLHPDREGRLSNHRGDGNDRPAADRTPGHLRPGPLARQGRASTWGSDPSPGPPTPHPHSTGAVGTGGTCQ